METTRTRVETALCRAGLYKPARDTYQRVFNRAYFAGRADARRFLSQFVRPGCVAFDIGANVGLMSERFAELGASVVAVEPHPRLAATIRRRYPYVSVVEAAIGEQPGTAMLHLGRDHIYSTVSDDWMQLVRAHPGWPDRWDGETEVLVITLAELIEIHGQPDFIKIDVEGHEDHVLSTLSHAVRALSFEYQCPDLDIGRRCVERLEDLGDYRFAAARGERFGLATDWLTAEALFDALEAEREGQENAHGDIYALLT
jgi:FkbM family methyltransferase